MFFYALLHFFIASRACRNVNDFFMNEAGRLHQQLAQICPQVTLITAGLAQQLKH
jgi:adenosyl cobinamide kinase/adenosyl cobinamide phosphate guanylyltransferase